MYAGKEEAKVGHLQAQQFAVNCSGQFALVNTWRISECGLDSGQSRHAVQMPR